MQNLPYIVLVPGDAVDETTMGEWLEERGAVYLSRTARSEASSHVLRFQSKEVADAFAGQFLG